jgi:hypothetical protein
VANVGSIADLIPLCFYWETAWNMGKMRLYILLLRGISRRTIHMTFCGAPTHLMMPKDLDTVQCPCRQKKNQVYLTAFPCSSFQMFSHVRTAEFREYMDVMPEEGSVRAFLRPDTVEKLVLRPGATTRKSYLTRTEGRHRCTGKLVIRE